MEEKTQVTPTKWFTFLQDQKLFSQIVCSKNLVRQVLRFKGWVLEVGAGSGINSYVVSQYGLESVALDVDCSSMKGLKNKHLHVVCADLFHLPFQPVFSLVFSQGVMEHFSKQKIVLGLVEQSKVSRYVLVEVPTGKWVLADKNCFGDERFFSVEAWKKIVVASNLKLRGVYGWGFLGRYKRVRRVLPPFVWKRIYQRFCNVVGFLCET